MLFRVVWTFFLTLVWPGVGLIYARKWLAGVAVCILSLILNTSVRWVSRSFLPRPAALVGFTVTFALFLAALLLLATYTARRVAHGARVRTPVPPWFQTSWFAAVIIVAAHFYLASIYKAGWDSYSIPSPSNTPALQVGDDVVASLVPDYRPTRGEMIVFKQRGQDWVKRVIGLPGETVKLTGGIVLINGQAAERGQPRPYRGADVPGTTNVVQAYEERLPDAGPHTILVADETSPTENTDDFKVPEGAYFVLGDNRDNSADSRFPQVGFIGQSTIIGKMQTIYWSRDHARILTPVR